MSEQQSVAYQLNQSTENQLAVSTAPLIGLVHEMGKQQVEMYESIATLIGIESEGKGRVEDEPIGVVGILRRALEHRLAYGAMLNRQLHELVANFE